MTRTTVYDPRRYAGMRGRTVRARSCGMTVIIPARQSDWPRGSAEAVQAFTAARASGQVDVVATTDLLAVLMGAEQWDEWYGRDPSIDDGLHLIAALMGAMPRQR